MAIATISGLVQPAQAGANSAAIVAWGSKLSSLFSGAGLVPAADSGQIDWATASFGFPGSGSGTVGYEVWALSDSLQATKPVYLIVNYNYCHTASFIGNTFFYLSFVITTATNGAGANAASYSLTFNQSVNPTSGSDLTPSVAWTAFSSGDGSSLALVVGSAGSVAARASAGLGTFYFDRTRDVVGAITGEGVVAAATGWQNYLVSNNPNAGLYGVLQMGAASVYMLGSSSASGGVMLPAYVPGSMAAGTAIGFAAPSVLCNGKKLPPVLAAVAYCDSDITAGSIVTVTVSGSPHTYYCLGDFCLNADRSPGSTTAALAVRYE